ncbi:MAG TPA: FAD-binding oxidoreductase [Alphaproteobacteria bacterium]|nr:FAD-binding oxidoreductase [Alphaproteobacteria bacterium]HAJ47617.1 FAD-binding oxidoreductase [Alphaproteobacteria bacterium]
MSDTLQSLAAIVGPKGFIPEAEARDWKAGPWPGLNTRAARAVLRPASTQEVSAILKVCHEKGQRVVPAGGLTGLVHGTDSAADEIVLSLERMNHILEIDPTGRTMTVEAGVPLQTIQEAADQAGMFFPLDLGARGSATIGGNIATNAGGNRVIRYGMTRELILGLEAVLADGTVLSHLNTLLKNNAGFDLKQLFIGTEGSLGVVTRAVLRLFEKPRSQTAALVAASDFEGVTRLLKHMDQALGGQLTAFEVMWSDVYEVFTTPPANNRPPLPHGHAFYVLVESMGGDPEADAARFEKGLDGALAQGMIADAALAASLDQVHKFWAIRDDVVQFIRYGSFITFDVSLPIRAMETYVAEVKARMAERFPGSVMGTFGHLGDCNLHFVACPRTEDPAARASVEAIVYAPLAAIKGSVSAEHGIGLEKKAYLPLSRTPEEIATMQRLKSALDPKGILNRGKVIDMAAAESLY